MPELAQTPRPPGPPPPEPPPDRLGGYRIYERLGTGGQACVYRARRIGDPDACDVALKRLHPHLIEDESAVQSFGREARIAYLLDHPVIRRVLALCREPGELFMIMEHIEGVSLSAVLERARRARLLLPLRGVLTVLHRLCDALHYAHELVDERGAPAGLVHRDVSPSNLIVTSSGRLKLIDLGVARSQSVDHQSNSGVVKGKLSYMAPEVMRSAPFDRRADIFSLGVMAWELLTSSKLFPLRNPPVDLERIRARAVPPPSSRNPACPAELDFIVLRALDKDPAERWSSAAALAEALQTVAMRLGARLLDGAMAELAEVMPGATTARLQAQPAPRAQSSLARGTPAELPSAVLLTSEPPAAAEPGQPPGQRELAPPVEPARPVESATTAEPPERVTPPEWLARLAAPQACPRCPRWLALGTAAGATGTYLILLLALHALRSSGGVGGAAATTPSPAVVARAAPVPLADAALGDADAALGDAGAALGDAGAALGDAGAADAAAAPTIAESPSHPGPASVGRPLLVDTSALTRRAGARLRRPRSAGRLRARVCIDATGAVLSTTVLEGPRRLQQELARSLRQWRELPSADPARVGPGCFELDLTEP